MTVSLGMVVLSPLMKPREREGRPPTPVELIYL